MTSARYRNLWLSMAEYDFEVDGVIPESVKCCLCNHLLVEPYISPCGCQSCEKCIRVYIEDTDNFCPGPKEECKVERLEMDKNVVKDYRAMQEVIKTIVKCPNESCLIKTELENIEAHIRECVKRCIDCPFKGIGCTSEGITEVNVNDHLHSSVMIHSELLIESNTHGKNEIHILRKDVEEKFVEINNLKEVIETYNKEVKDLSVLVRKLIVEKELDNIELFSQRKEIIECQEEVQQLYALFNTLQIEFFKKEDLIANNSEEKCKELQKKKQLQEKIEGFYKSFTENLKSVKENNSKSSTYSKTITSKCEVNSENSIQMKEMNVYDFIWKIEKFSEMQKGSYDSAIFNKNNCKFCLRLILGRYDLCLYLCIIKREMENPENGNLKQMVSLHFINQETMTAYTNDKYKCDNCRHIKSRFYKPNNMAETMVGGRWMTINDLNTIPGLLFEDSLLVCCTLLP